MKHQDFYQLFKRLIGLSVTTLLFATLYPYIALVIQIIGTMFLIYHYLKKRSETIQTLIQYLQRLNRGDYRHELSAYQEGELAALFSELNKTTFNQRKLNQALIQQKEFLKDAMEDISHQLKTPLTALSILNELQNQDDELVLKSHLQIQRLKRLVRSLLKLTQLDAQTLPCHQEPIDIAKLLQTILASMSPLIENHNLKIIVDIPTINVWADYQHLFEALYNIIHNKLRIAASTITIVAQQDERYTELQIYDDGRAIPIKERTKIFTRFYSGTHKNPDSIGIGLAIAQALIQFQNGDIIIKDANTFLITLPNNYDKNVRI